MLTGAGKLRPGSWNEVEKPISKHWVATATAVFDIAQLSAANTTIARCWQQSVVENCDTENWKTTGKLYFSTQTMLILTSLS